MIKITNDVKFIFRKLKVSINTDLLNLNKNIHLRFIKCFLS